ncbi:malate synthase G [Raineyella sp.]|uniref:Malate synthase G n=1 Tax=bioreactor metagenome TaxID=1076179 RepID=A0A644Y3R7_9ZZZZ|nr:malate synthase G [Raineyella sp.]MEA5155860.1 malate synthase G [Raineyella sp.]
MTTSTVHTSTGATSDTTKGMTTATGSPAGVADDTHEPIGDLLVDRRLVEFLDREALPGAGVDPARFWDGFVRVFRGFTGRNRALLAERDRLQTTLDQYHREHPGTPDPADYQAFLRRIGYLLDEPAGVRARTRNVDTEIAQVAGPQLVVPVMNRRFAINAANARWGSLYDALYGTDAISEADGATRGPGYNPLRGQRVIAWARAFLDRAVPLTSGSHADVVEYRAGQRLRATLRSGEIVGPVDEDAFAGFTGAPGAPKSILLRHHGLHIDIRFDFDSPIGRADRAHISDIVLEAAITAIMDFEDSVAAVDGPDKVVGYRNWLGLNDGSAAEVMEKGGRTFTRTLAADPTWSAPDGSEVRLPGRSLMLCRNVGHLMTTPAVLDEHGEELPEGILDALVTSLCAMPGLEPTNQRANSRAGSIYIVKPKQHGPAEVAFTSDLFAAVEDVLGLERNTIKMGIMDEERRTTVNLMACIEQAADRIIFINTGFLDRTGDEIHTSMAAGAMIRKAEMKSATWMTNYEDWNVDVGLACGLPGRAQIGKGMWAMTELMADMLATKIAHPAAGANTAWVPSPTGATLHVTHYHDVNVWERQADILQQGRRATLAGLLDIPLAPSTDWTAEEKRREVENSCQSILGYVVRWIEQGVGCSKVPDINDVDLMEDRATCRISSQMLANWIHHDVVSAEFVVDAFRRMAVVVDQQNAADPDYLPMTPSTPEGSYEDSIAWCAARDLALEGTRSPSGYTEPILHARRREFKAAHGLV